MKCINILVRKIICMCQKWSFFSFFFLSQKNPKTKQLRHIFKSIYFLVDYWLIYSTFCDKCKNLTMILPSTIFYLSIHSLILWFGVLKMRYVNGEWKYCFLKSFYLLCQLFVDKIINRSIILRKKDRQIDR